MAAICWFFHYTPTQYRALRLGDLAQLRRFMRDYLKAR